MSSPPCAGSLSGENRICSVPCRKPLVLCATEGSHGIGLRKGGGGIGCWGTLGGKGKKRLVSATPEGERHQTLLVSKRSRSTRDQSHCSRFTAD